MDNTQFDKLAQFNKFILSDEEKQLLINEFERVLSLLEPLRQADFGDTPLMVHADTVKPVYRADEAYKIVSRNAVLSGAPEIAENCFAVPRVAD